MTKPTFYLFGLTLLLAGCASEVNTNVHYYLLDNAASISMPDDIAQRPTTVAIQTIELADYLKQASLNMQMDNHQVFYSKQHYWAQPLQTSIRNSLLNDLNKTSKTAYFVDPQLVNFKQADLTLGLKINHFLPTYESKVVLAGQYWIYNDQSNRNLTDSIYNFKYELPLAENGYGHAVGKLRNLLEQLSKDIVINMENVEI
ncbi:MULTISPECIES: PqiC family protein [Aliiglaciecola]|uniref:PqiC family protein n=1 Tax=Aliiglaciecola TaxID=1406885 RepID=UPI001C0822A8|nr:ABC-type transport auxiliary lipoprotein family protein [Aliiglaciecola lipolytica]MBU2878159.1 membrane integrity-associated transporter subunit PqiC [Aliiglaciecola lipolytica]